MTTPQPVPARCTNVALTWTTDRSGTHLDRMTPCTEPATTMFDTARAGDRPEWEPYCAEHAEKRRAFRAEGNARIKRAWASRGDGDVQHDIFGRVQTADGRTGQVVHILASDYGPTYLVVFDSLKARREDRPRVEFTADQLAPAPPLAVPPVPLAVPPVPMVPPPPPRAVRPRPAPVPPAVVTVSVDPVYL